jgi:ABC-type multidrug transport system fused ATPase/permease subunit
MKFLQQTLAPFLRLYAILPESSKRGLVVVVLISLIAAIFETLSVASILPFMALVMDPSIIDQYPMVKHLLTSLGIESKSTEIIAAGVLTIAVLSVGNAISATNLWVQTRYLATTRRALSSELFAGYMRLPYSFHIQRDAPSLTRVIGGDVESALGGFLASLLLVVSKTLSGSILITLIVLVNPLVALGSVLVLGGAYLLVYRIIRARQADLGNKMVRASTLLARTVTEGLAGVKELRILGRELTATEQYSDTMKSLAQTNTANVVATAMPRYVIEIFAYAGIVAVTLVLVLKGDAAGAMPSLALYALAGNRLVPMFQQLFAGAITIKYHTSAVDALEKDLRVVRAADLADFSDSTEPMAFRREIRLQGVGFTYPTANRPALADITLTIRQNQSVGLVGRTGSGKTTLADILLGLYPADRGEILVDDVVLTESNARSWRKRVGYVPQHVFLNNATVSQNIALGLPLDQIDPAAVRRAAQMAQAAEFIEQLPSGYDTVVGERGVKLSGGQRQRLGIARALYHNPDVLVFDEATSALDGMTEDAVMQAVQSLSSERTLILIAHRLRTIQACDRIIMLDAGRIVADGAYDELIATSAAFQKLAGRVAKS